MYTSSLILFICIAFEITDPKLLSAKLKAMKSWYVALSHEVKLLVKSLTNTPVIWSHFLGTLALPVHFSLLNKYIRTFYMLPVIQCCIQQASERSDVRVCFIIPLMNRRYLSCFLADSLCFLFTIRDCRSIYRNFKTKVIDRGKPHSRQTPLVLIGVIKVSRISESSEKSVDNNNAISADKYLLKLTDNNWPILHLKSWRS